MVQKRLLLGVVVGLLFVFLGVVGLLGFFDSYTAHAVKMCDTPPCLDEQRSLGTGQKYHEAGSGQEEQHPYDLTERKSVYDSFLQTDTLEDLSGFYVLKSDDVVRVYNQAVRFIRSQRIPFAPLSTQSQVGYVDAKALMVVSDDYGLRQDTRQIHSFPVGKVRVTNGLPIVVAAVHDDYGMDNDMSVVGFPGLSSDTVVDFHPVLRQGEQLVVDGHTFVVDTYVSVIGSENHVSVLVDGKALLMSPHTPYELNGLTFAVEEVSPFLDKYYFDFLDVDEVYYVGSEYLFS